MGGVCQRPHHDSHPHRTGPEEHHQHLHRQSVHQRHPQPGHQQPAGAGVLLHDDVGHRLGGVRDGHAPVGAAHGLVALAHRARGHPPAHRRRLQPVLQEDLEERVHHICAGVCTRGANPLLDSAVSWIHVSVRTKAPALHHQERIWVVHPVCQCSSDDAAVIDFNCVLHRHFC